MQNIILPICKYNTIFAKIILSKPILDYLTCTRVGQPHLINGVLSQDFPHGFCLTLRKIPTFCQFPGVEMLWKDTISVEFQTIYSKLCGNCLSTKFPHLEIRQDFGVLGSVKSTCEMWHLESSKITKNTQKDSIIYEKVALFSVT